MTYLLRFTSPLREGIGHIPPTNPGPFYFQHLGEQWPNDPRYRLISHTTSIKSEARQFNTAEEAQEVLVTARHPKGWEIIDA